MSHILLVKTRSLVIYTGLYWLVCWLLQDVPSECSCSCYCSYTVSNTCLYSAWNFMILSLANSWKVLSTFFLVWCYFLSLKETDIVVSVSQDENSNIVVQTNLLLIVFFLMCINFLTFGWFPRILPWELMPSALKRKKIEVLMFDANVRVRQFS